MPPPKSQPDATVGPSDARGYTLVVLREDQDVPATFEFEPGRSVVLGREQSCDVTIDDRSVSRRHARLFLSDEVLIEDLGSANGTRTQGWRRAESEEAEATERANLVDTKLAPGQRERVALGQVVQLGTVVLIVQRGAPSSLPSAAFEHRKEKPSKKAAPDLVLEDEAMRRLHRLAERVAPSMLTVLLLGETGTGKEVLAEAVHRHSPRRNKPFLRLNCGAFAEALLESEFFGHERGAFSGAVQAKQGLIEAAHGGTILLDEVGDLSPALQVKLLRVLEDGKVLRVGATEPRPIDVRFIAATHRDLGRAVREARFRQDLYYRLNGVSLCIPPLRERRSEIVPLALHFLERHAEATGQPAPAIDPTLAAWLEAQPWPGNVRELRHAVERAAVFSEDGRLRTKDFLALQGRAPDEHDGASAPVERGIETELSTGRLKSMLAKAERNRILRALDACGGNQSKAAKMLGMSRGTLLVRMNAFKLPRPRRR